jgi:hypothetical protein
VTIFNVYCDESRHLQADESSAMVLGAVWVESDRVTEITRRIREIKNKHGISPYAELKWTSVSPSKLQMYIDVIDYFFDDEALHFRGVIASKNGLKHDQYAQSHDDWYYKMMFVLLKTILDPKNQFNIYLDHKDTRSAERVRSLKLFLNKTTYEFDESLVGKLQTIRSHESALLQLTDLISGALAFNRSAKQESAAKKRIVERIKERSGKSLQKSTLFREDKLNLLNWSPQEVEG